MNAAYGNLGSAGYGRSPYSIPFPSPSGTGGIVWVDPFATGGGSNAADYVEAQIEATTPAPPQITGTFSPYRIVGPAIGARGLEVAGILPPPGTLVGTASAAEPWPPPGAVGADVFVGPMDSGGGRRGRGQRRGGRRSQGLDLTTVGLGAALLALLVGGGAFFLGKRGSGRR